MNKTNDAWVKLLNQKFNKLTIIEILGNNKASKKLCLAKCDCGTIKQYITSNIKSSTTKSCGQCPTIDLIGTKVGPYTVIECVGLKKTGAFSQFYWKVECGYGHKKSYSTNDVKRVRHVACTECKKLENGLKWYYSRYRYDAKDKNRKFELSFEDFSKITSENCVYCGQEPRYIRIRGANPLKLNGVDRIDSEYGYIKNNVATCCTQCNRMKMALSTKDFLNHIDKIHDYKFGLSKQIVCLNEITKAGNGHD